MANTVNDNNGEGNFVQPSIPRLDKHYEHWSMLMENFLRSKEYWYLIENGVGEPREGEVLTEAHQKKLDESRLKDMKAKNYLFQAIDRITLETILKKDTSKDIWKSLKRKFQGNARVKRSTLNALRKEFESLEMKSSETIADYIPRVMQIANKMRINGENLGDSVIVEKTIRSLTEKYNYIVCSIEESKDTDKMSIDELQSSLIVHEQKLLRTYKNNGEEQALKTATQERGDTNSGARGRGSIRGRGRGRGRQNKDTVECYKCKKLGHYRNECPDWDKEANYAEGDDDDTMLLMAIAESQKSKKETWYLDSGCSNHMSGNKKWFTDLDEGFKKTVRL